MATPDEEIDIVVDGQHIAGTLVSPAPLVPGVLFVHGWGGSQEKYLARAREIAALGCVCLTFNLRGHAETEPQHDTVTREDNLRDLLAAYDVLAGHPLVDGGFKWSSQHLDGGGCDEGWETALGSGATSRVAGVAWPTRRGAAGEPAAVLGGDCGGSVESEAAAIEAGVSPAVGARWFREAGGMPPTTLAPS